MKTMTRNEVREFDRHCIEDLGVVGLVLMENAGRQAADEAQRLLRDGGGRRAVIVAGRGNNGGDGFVVARHLLLRGFEPGVVLLADPAKLSGDAAANFRLLESLGIAVTAVGGDAGEVAEAVRAACDAADLVIDAVLGTGISGEVREPLRSAIEAINHAGRPVLAIDIPSGLDADAGRPLGVAVVASTTVTFVAAKQGFAAEGAERFTGRVVVADIGVPLGT